MAACWPYVVVMDYSKNLSDIVRKQWQLTQSRSVLRCKICTGGREGGYIPETLG